MVEVDSLLFALDQVCTRHERAVAAVQAVEQVSAEEPAAVCADPVSVVYSVGCMDVTETKVDPQFDFENMRAGANLIRDGAEPLKHGLSEVGTHRAPLGVRNVC